MNATQAPRTAIGQGGRIFIFGFLSAIAPLSIDIYLPALPTMRAALAANEAQTLYTLSTFFIGFGGGQLLFGPLTDRFGRKRPLLCGLAIYIAASAGCALAPSITLLVVFRFIQALGGSIVPITVQAMVRDLYARNESARILSLNLLVTASAPIVAPLIGGQLLLWLDWRFIFWVLVAFGALAFIAALVLPETLAAARRSQANPLTLVLGYAALLRNRRYLGYVACSTSYFCCLFAFIAGSPFVYIEYFGAAASLVLLVTGVSGFAGVPGIAVPLFVVLALLTMVASNGISGALAVAPSAGTAAALAGALQFGAGAFVSAATGWLAGRTPRAM